MVLWLSDSDAGTLVPWMLGMLGPDIGDLGPLDVRFLILGI